MQSSTLPPLAKALPRPCDLEKGGRLVINAIKKKDHDKDYLKNLFYQDNLWMEKELKSVANITDKDVSEFMELAAKVKISPNFQVYPLEEANKALLEVKEQYISRAKALRNR